MSVSSHLAVSPAAYDRRIREFILHYDEIIGETARALRHARVPVRSIVDLGIGTGSLSRACLRELPKAGITGIDEDATMMAVAAVRLRRWRRQLKFVNGNFERSAVPRAEAVVATFALHHIRTTGAKLEFYRRCRRALSPGGVIVSGDCLPASNRMVAESDLRPWLAHLARSAGSLAAARRTYESWGDEDTYTPLATEIDLMREAGFEVEVAWRRAPFAVIAGVRPTSTRRR